MEVIEEREPTTQERSLTAKEFGARFFRLSILVGCCLLSAYFIWSGFQLTFTRFTDPDITLQEYRDLEENDIVDDAPLILMYYFNWMPFALIAFILFSNFTFLSFNSIILEYRRGRLFVLEAEVLAKKKKIASSGGFDYMMKLDYVNKRQQEDRMHKISLSQYKRIEEGSKVRLHVIGLAEKISSIKGEGEETGRLLRIEFPPFRQNHPSA